MKLYCGPSSPYVRKVLVTVIEAGLDEEIEQVRPANNVWIDDGDDEVSKLNPVGKLPTLITRQGFVLTESTLICEYLATLVPERALLPESGDERWQILAHQAFAHGLIDVVITKAVEVQVRPDEYSWPKWVARQETKISRILDCFELNVQKDGSASLQPSSVNLATITLGTALAYMTQRIGDDTWKASRPNLVHWFEQFSKRPSMLATVQFPLPPPELDPRRG